MKTIILSFDDARSDFYSRALPIMLKHGIPSTLNVITNYLRDCPSKQDITCSSYSVGLSIDELLQCYKSGLVEIACHGANHKNTRADVEQNMKDLRNLGINEPIFGFASPGSFVTEKNKNDHGIWDLVEEKKLSYVRSGIQIKREGYLYALLSIIDKYIHSKRLFKYLNRKCIIATKEHLRDRVLPSVTIFSYTQLHQLKYLIESTSDSSTIILMFHSVLQKGDKGYGMDKFYFDAERFEALCRYLKSQSEFRICTTKDLFTI